MGVFVRGNGGSATTATHMAADPGKNSAMSVEDSHLMLDHIFVEALREHVAVS